MTQTVEQVLGRTAFRTDAVDYRLLRLPANCITLAAAIVAETAEPFSALVVDQDEVSLVMRQDLYQRYAPRLRPASLSDQSYRLITFEETLEPELVGFLARVGAALAAASIPILAFAAYSRDHIFVPSEYLSRALEALQALQMEARRGSD